MGGSKAVWCRDLFQYWWRRAVVLVLVILLSVSLGSCDRPSINTTPLLDINDGSQQILPLQGSLSEVSPPETVQTLKSFLEVYEPQVQIVSPKDGATLEQLTVSVQIRVRDLPIYQDPDLGLGPHLHLILDDQPGQDIYDADTTITFDNLAPGTHTLRAFAASPWHESFKNAGAFDQATFNIFTPSSANSIGQNTPLLTYGQPQGHYGAEPILLDLHLSNVPLHMIAAEDDTVLDWRIRCTVNGESFVFDRWQPLYLRGFKPGQNWVKVELIDETGQQFPGPFNSAIGIVEYQPGEMDTLSRLVRDEIPTDLARVLVDPTYEPPVITPEEQLEAEESPETEALPEEVDGSESETDRREDNAIQADSELSADQTTPPESIGDQTSEEDNISIDVMPAEDEPGDSSSDVNAAEPIQTLQAEEQPSDDLNAESNEDANLETNNEPAILEVNEPGRESINVGIDAETDSAAPEPSDDESLENLAPQEILPEESPIEERLDAAPYSWETESEESLEETQPETQSVD
ncbi:MAG: hypothetical protein ACFB0C_05175 [Leptolyngbyaceae cyanobacterium]